MSTTPPVPDLRSLTSLRFFAALMVVLLHASVTVPPFPGFDRLVAQGYVGVTFFFILSGFVLAWAYRPGDRAGAFYGRRFARVWPLHAVVTIVVVGLMAASGQQQNWAALLAVLLLAQAWIPSPEFFYAYNGPSWSLSCETFFYALFPILRGRAAGVARPGRLLAAVLLTIWLCTAVVLGARPAGVTLGLPEGIFDYLLYLFPAFRVLEFALGVLLGVLVRSGWRSPLTLSQAACLTVLGLVAVTGAANLLWDHPGDLPTGVADAALAGPFVLLIASAATSDLGGAQTWLRRPVWVRLGAGSFALYLVHQPVLELTQAHVPAVTAWSGAVVFLGAVSMSLLLAEVAHRVIENPVERRLRRRLGARSTSTPTAT